MSTLALALQGDLPEAQRIQKQLAVDALRARYCQLPMVHRGQLAMDVPVLDTWLGGWPVGALTEVAGLPGSGRLALLVPLLRRLARQGQRVVVVDPGQVFHPPALPELAESVLLLRPPPDQSAWVAEQVARAGAVKLAILLDLPQSERGGARLAKAAEAGLSAVIVVSSESDVALPAALRLCVGGWMEPQVLRVRCTRARDGRALGERRVPLAGRVLGGLWPMRSVR